MLLYSLREKPALCLKSKILGQPVDVTTLGGGQRRGEFVLFLVFSVPEILKPQVHGHPEVFRDGDRRIETATTSASSASSPGSLSTSSTPSSTRPKNEALVNDAVLTA